MSDPISNTTPADTTGEPDKADRNDVLVKIGLVGDAQVGVVFRINLL